MRPGRYLGEMMVSMMGTGQPDADTIKLPPPHAAGGMPLMQALKARHSERGFDDRSLPLALLSDLLWAANGVNRAESGQRTAPSAHDWREIEIYVATATGTYRYDSPAHTLQRVGTHDLRALTGVQDFVARAPLNLVYVAELDRMTEANAEDKAFYRAADAAFIAQNVYLFCASVGLAAVVRGLIDRESLGQALGLGEHQRVVLAQTVGYAAAGGAERLILAR